VLPSTSTMWPWRAFSVYVHVILRKLNKNMCAS
jgi:hypothetical protein